MHSLFSDCYILANGTKVSSANGLHGHKAFVETEFSYGKEAKDTWLTCQGYTYETDPEHRTDAAIAARTLLTNNSDALTLFGKLSSDFLSCEKLMLPNVSMRIKLIRAHNDFVVVSDAGNKHYRVQILEANLYVRKMTVSENVLESIERVLLSTPAMYSYTEVIPKTFIIPAGQNGWKHEDIFTKEPIRRIAIAMNTNTAVAGTNDQNPYYYQKFGLRSITIYRNGIPIAGTPLSTVDNNRLYFKSLSALSFTDQGHGISLADYPNHFVMVFDLTSTQEAAHDFIYPELTNASLSIEMSFGAQLAEAVEILFLGERSSTVFIDSNRNITKNALLPN